MLGYTSGGWTQYEAYRPSVESFSKEVNEARGRNVNPSSAVPLPYGWDFDVHDQSLLLEPSAKDYPRLVKAFGFIAHIDQASSDDTPDAFTASIVVKLPFRFGEKDSEASHSWAFCRVSAFAAKAISFPGEIWGFFLGFSPGLSHLHRRGLPPARHR